MTAKLFHTDWQVARPIVVNIRKMPRARLTIFPLSSFNRFSPIRLSLSGDWLRLYCEQLFDIFRQH